MWFCVVLTCVVAAGAAPNKRNRNKSLSSKSNPQELSIVPSTTHLQPDASQHVSPHVSPHVSQQVSQLVRRRRAGLPLKLDKLKEIHGEDRTQSVLWFKERKLSSTTINKPEVKFEVKPEVKPEVKHEVKSDQPKRKKMRHRTNPQTSLTSSTTINQVATPVSAIHAPPQNGVSSPVSNYESPASLQLRSNGIAIVFEAFVEKGVTKVACRICRFDGIKFVTTTSDSARAHLKEKHGVHANVYVAGRDPKHMMKVFEISKLAENPSYGKYDWSGTYRFVRMIFAKSMAKCIIPGCNRKFEELDLEVMEHMFAHCTEDGFPHEYAVVAMQRGGVDDLPALCFLRRNDWEALDRLRASTGMMVG